MKILTIALVAASLAAAPLAAFAYADGASVQPVPAQNKTEKSKDWKIGDRVPPFTSSSKYKADVTALNLPKAPENHRWLHVGDNAYLVNNSTDKIVQIAGAPEKS